jgi:hypothetical protein
VTAATKSYPPTLRSQVRACLRVCHVCMCACVHVRVHFKCVCACMCVHVCACVPVCMSACVHVCMCVHACRRRTIARERACSLRLVAVCARVCASSSSCAVAPCRLKLLSRRRERWCSRRRRCTTRTCRPTPRRCWRHPRGLTLQPQTRRVRDANRCHRLCYYPWFYRASALAPRYHHSALLPMLLPLCHHSVLVPVLLAVLPDVTTPC